MTATRIFYERERSPFGERLSFYTHHSLETCVHLLRDFAASHVVPVAENHYRFRYTGEFGYYGQLTGDLTSNEAGTRVTVHSYISLSTVIFCIIWMLIFGFLWFNTGFWLYLLVGPVGIAFVLYRNWRTRSKLTRQLSKQLLDT